MILEYDKSFEKSLEKIKDNTILHRIENAILKAEKAATIESIPNSKKLLVTKGIIELKLVITD